MGILVFSLVSGWIPICRVVDSQAISHTRYQDRNDWMARARENSTIIFQGKKPRASREAPRPSSSPTDASHFRRLFKGHEAPLLSFPRPLILSILRHYHPNFTADETRARRNWVACPSGSLEHRMLMPRCHKSVLPPVMASERQHKWNHMFLSQRNNFMNSGFQYK